MKLSDLLDLHRTGSAALRPLRGALRLLRPSRLDSDAGADYANEVQRNPLIKRFPRAEQTRIAGELRTEKESTRRTAGAIARHHARRARAAVARGREVIGRARRDVRISMPEALEHVDANGMIMLALLRVQLMPLLRAAGPAELFGVLQAANQRKDARGYVEAEIIEGLIATGGTALPADDVERGIAKQLREYVSDVQEWRLGTDIPDFDALAAEADHLDALADAIGLAPIDPDQMPAAGEAFAQLAADLDAAAELSADADIEQAHAATATA